MYRRNILVWQLLSCVHHTNFVLVYYFEHFQGAAFPLIPRNQRVIQRVARRNGVARPCCDAGEPVVFASPMAKACKVRDLLGEHGRLIVDVCDVDLHLELLFFGWLSVICCYDGYVVTRSVLLTVEYTSTADGTDGLKVNSALR